MVYKNRKVELNAADEQRLNDARIFVNHLLDNDIRVYSITTGFGDLRDKPVSKQHTDELSYNIIMSHDAGIGEPIPQHITKGAMLLCANSLSKGYSGIKVSSLTTLIAMINENIIPIIPSSGSLGASGDLAFLARLGRAMQGHDVAVWHNGIVTTAEKALSEANIALFKPTAKEGLALTNGTSFMLSELLINYMRQISCFENIFASLALYLNATSSPSIAFASSVHNARNQKGQSLVASILHSFMDQSPFYCKEHIQADYSQRCLPQILGAKIDLLYEQKSRIFNEINAVTDNPLIFRDDEITPDIKAEHIFHLNDARWTVISSGNFHGEVLASTADILRLINAKVALTLERQLNFLSNSWRNKGLFNEHLVYDANKLGLHSGYMIPVYTVNALTQKICYLAQPVTNFNISSSNEVEDVVSYGASSVELLSKSLDYMDQLTAVYLSITAQAYAIAREAITNIDPNLISERIFATIQDAFQEGFKYPTKEEISFSDRYNVIADLLASSALPAITNYPITKNGYFDKESELIPS